MQADAKVEIGRSTGNTKSWEIYKIRCIVDVHCPHDSMLPLKLDILPKLNMLLQCCVSIVVHYVLSIVLTVSYATDSISSLS